MILNHIGFDIDGTLIDEVSFCVKNFLSFYEETFHRRYNGLIDISKYPLMERFPDCEDKDFLKRFEKYYWNIYLMKAPFRPYVKELFQTLKKMGVTIHIVTARHETENETIEDVEKRTKNRFEREGIPVDEFHIGFEEKASICKGAGIELLVEDSPEQVLNVSEYIPVFVFNCSYNVNIKGRNIWRISSYNPNEFIENVKYAINHIDNWDVSYDYEENSSDEDFEESSGIDFVVSERGTVCINQKNIQLKNIIFVIPFNHPENDSFAATLATKVKNSMIINLNYIEQDSESISNLTNYIDSTPGMELLFKVIKKHNPKEIDLTDPNSTDGYEIKCKIIEECLKIAEKRKSDTFIFFGVQTMMLKRDVTKKYKDNTIFLTGVSDNNILKISNNRYRSNYNPWIMLEDLTDVATQIRKWKIIAGTAPKEIHGYINRQTTTSEGIDIVRLLPDESAYHQDELETVLSRNTYLLGDCHISSKDHAKTDRIINAINRTVPKDGVLLFLGDFDGKKGTGSYELTKNFLSKIKCKNLYLILGNNDPYTIEDYVKLGFRAVTDMAVFQESPNRKVILTHCPYPVERDEVNIHGHIHGSRTYWNMDWKQHYDVWDEDFIPITIGRCLEILDKGEYKAHSENHPIY